MITPLGKLSVGALNVKLMLSLGVLQGFAADLKANLDANVAISASLPGFDLAGLLANIQALIAQLEAGLVPSISFNADINAGLSAKLELLQPFLDLAAKLALGGPGLYAYAYDGAVGAFGPEFTGEFASGMQDQLPPQHAQGLVLLAVDPEVFATLGLVLKVTP